jgi:type II secretory pathway predicted ATPase ExeA
LLTGEIGAGKTLLSRIMLRHFGGTITFAHITHAVRSAQDLIESVCTELEIPCSPGCSHAHLIRSLHDFLLEQFSSNKPVVLVLDEAQNLPQDGFEQLRMVGNLEADDAKLLQIIIVGQPELRGLIASPSLRQLRQRICRSFHLGGMNRTETQAYILHRLSVAGASDATIFEPSAIDRIAAISGGLPRVVNTLCDTALVNAYAANVKTMDGRFIDALEDQTIAAGAAEGRSIPIPAPQMPTPQGQPTMIAASNAPVECVPAATARPAPMTQETQPVQTPQPIATTPTPPPPALETLEQRAAETETRLRMRRLENIQTAVTPTSTVHPVVERARGELSRMSQEVQGRIEEAISGLGKLGHRFTGAVQSRPTTQIHEDSLTLPTRDFSTAVKQARREGAILARRESRMTELLSKLDSFVQQEAFHFPFDREPAPRHRSPSEASFKTSATEPTTHVTTRTAIDNVYEPVLPGETGLLRTLIEPDHRAWPSIEDVQRTAIAPVTSRQPIRPKATSTIRELVAEADQLAGLVDGR